jgi:ribonucleotide reductase beta subunit family protein with ferritin-like domain
MNLDIFSEKEHNLLNAKPIYKPFKYPWAYDAWLTQQKIHWIAEEVPLSDDVKDWKVKLNKNERDLLTQIFRFFTQSDIEVNGCYMQHYMKTFKPTEILMMLCAFSNIECFSEDTEILTNCGWIKFPDLKKEHKVAQYNQSNGEISFVAPKKIVSYDYKDDLIYFEDKNTDLLITPNHDLLVISKDLLEKSYKSNSRVDLEKRHAINCESGLFYPVAGKVSVFEEKLTDKEKLLIILHNATLSQSNSVLLVETKNTKQYDYILQLLDNLDIKHETDEGKISFEIEELKVSLDQIKNLSWIKIEKINTSWSHEFVHILTDEGFYKRLEEFEEIFNKIFKTKNKNILDIIQTICVLGGFSCSINNIGAEFVLEIQNDSMKPLPKISKQPYDGKVWCVSVETENIVVRRNNKVAITGNTVHIDAYSKLIDTVGMPEVEYSAFLNYKEMCDKYEYMHQFNVDTKFDIAVTLAGFGAFTEGLQLFASFAILLNFQRFNKMKGMCQIVAWSVRDECYSDDTEILTTNGWKLFQDLSKDDLVAQFNKDNKEISFIKPKKIVSYDGGRDMVSIESPDLNFNVTANHRKLVISDDNFDIVEAKDLINKGDCKIPVAGYFNQDSREIFGGSLIDGNQIWIEDILKKADLIEKDIYFYKNLSKEEMDFIQAVASLSGYSTKYSDDELSLFKNDSKEIPTKALSSKYENNKVWCVEVETGFLVVRRNNSVCISGNTLHTESIIKLFKTFLQENPEINTAALKEKITQTAKDIIALEDEFIKLAFNGSSMEGLKEQEVKSYIRYIGDRRLLQLGYEPVFGVTKNPLPWLDEILNGVEFTNFFENRVTEYSKASTEGDWNSVFD